MVAPLQLLKNQLLWLRLAKNKLIRQSQKVLNFQEANLTIKRKPKDVFVCTLLLTAINLRNSIF